MIMKILTAMFIFLALFIALNFLDAILLGKIEQHENAVFAALVGVVSLLNMVIIARLRKRDL